VDIGQLFSIVVGTIFINNFVLARFLGLCPYIGVSRQTKPALSMGMAVIFVMTLASIVTWSIYRYILVPFSLEYLRTVSFILVIASLVQFVEMAIRKFSPPLYRALGIYLPLITTNCAVLGVAVLNIDKFFAGSTPVAWSFLKSLTQGFSAGVGFALAMILMSGIRERLDLANVPPALKGVPIAFIVAGLMAISFLGFSGFQF